MTIAAVGDIACDPSEPAWNGDFGTPAGCQHRAVADAVRGINLQAFLALESRSATARASSARQLS